MVLNNFSATTTSFISINSSIIISYSSIKLFDSNFHVLIYLSTISHLPSKMSYFNFSLDSHKFKLVPHSSYNYSYDF